MQFDFLTASLPTRPAYFGSGSVELVPSDPVPNEKIQGGPTRRLAMTSEQLLTQPNQSVHTIPDVVDFAARTHGDRFYAVGWRDVIQVHEESKKVTRLDNGAETEEVKTWKLYELSDYKFLNFIEFRDAIAEVARGLLRLGVGRDHIVNIYAQTSVNWQLISHACASMSTTIATAYDTLGVDGLSHSLNEPECVAIFTNTELFPTLLLVIPKTPKLKFIIYDGTPDPDLLERIQHAREDIEITHLHALRENGRDPLNQEEEASFISRRPTPETLACIMYTSGSTGSPKGVCISHGNLVASVASVAVVFGPHVPTGDIYLAYLPLAHVLEYIVELCAVYVGITSGYARPKTLTDAGVKGCRGDLVALKPHIMFGVPSVWETIRKGIVSKVNSGGGVKKALFYAAIEARKRGTPVLSSLLEKIVLSKVREATGGRLKFSMNGGAPISRETQEFLSVALMPMMQGYGMTESCGMCALLPPELMQYGAVGLPVPSLEIKLLDMAEAGYFSSNSPPQGEICIRGPSVCKGYYKRPDLNSDESIFTKDGWFRTGDIGQWNADGTLSVIDRVKNLVKMISGEYIALERLESIYKACQYVLNVCVHAKPGTAYPIAVIVIHEANLRATLSAQASPDQTQDIGALCDSDTIRNIIRAECNNVGRKNGLKGPEILGGVILTPTEWTPDTGFVTAAQKINRNAIAKAFEKEIKTLLG